MPTKRSYVALPFSSTKYGGLGDESKWGLNWPVKSARLSWWALSGDLANGSRKRYYSTFEVHLVSDRDGIRSWRAVAFPPESLGKKDNSGMRQLRSELNYTDDIDD